MMAKLLAAFTQTHPEDTAYKPSQPLARPPGEATNLCWECGNPGHFRKDCPLLSQGLNYRGRRCSRQLWAGNKIPWEKKNVDHPIGYHVQFHESGKTPRRVGKWHHQTATFSIPLHNRFDELPALESAWGSVQKHNRAPSPHQDRSATVTDLDPQRERCPLQGYSTKGEQGGSRRGAVISYLAK